MESTGEVGTFFEPTEDEPAIKQPVSPSALRYLRSDGTPLAALDLPLKVLVWADGDQTKVSYTAPRALAARYSLSEELAGRLAGIDALTDAVIAR